MSNSTSTTINEQVTKHLEEIKFGIETSSDYFKPQPDKVYLIKIDPQRDKIVPVETDRFKDAKGNPVKRYQFKITHVNTGTEQLWDTSKTVCLQIIEQLKKGFTALKVVRIGADRSTVYTIEGVQ